MDVKGPASAEWQVIFLDRDGVINEKLPEDNYVQFPEDFKLLPGWWKHSRSSGGSDTYSLW